MCAGACPRTGTKEKRFSSRVLQAIGLTALLAAWGCDSSSTITTGPSPEKCQVALAASSTALAASGGTGTVSVSTQPECAWSATPEASWISGLSPASGQGNGQVAFQVPANPLPSARQGAIAVNGNRVSINQEAATCAFEIAPLTQSVAAGGGTGSVTVTTASGCSWSAASGTNWITVTSGESGSGAGTVAFSVAANAGGERTGTLTIAGQAFTVTQAGASVGGGTCVYDINPKSQSFGAGGVAGAAFSVATATGCAWTASSNAPWIHDHVRSDRHGQRVGRVQCCRKCGQRSQRQRSRSRARRFRSLRKPRRPARSPSRRQHSPCASAGGAGAPIVVSTTAGCAWTASEQCPVDHGHVGCERQRQRVGRRSASPPTRAPSGPAPSRLRARRSR